MSTRPLYRCRRAARAQAPAPAPPPDEFLTAAEAAKLLKVNQNTLYFELARGNVPAKRVGSRWVISRRALLDWAGCKSSEERGK